MLPGGGTIVTYVEPSSFACRLSRDGGGDLSKFLATGRAFVEEEEEECEGSGPMEWVSVLETTSREHSLCIRSNPSGNWSPVAQNVTLRVSEELALPSQVVVFRSVLFPIESRSMFERLADIQVDPSSRTIVLPELGPDQVLTVASVDRGQQKGSVPPSPPEQSFPAVFFDDFESYRPQATPRYWSDQTGIFSVSPRPDGQGQALLQNVTTQMITWHLNSDDAPYPISIAGEASTTTSTLSADIAILQNSSVSPTPENPTLSLQPCDVSALDQQWTWNPQGTIPGSLRDGHLSQCMDVFGCDSAVNTSAWMWPCVSSSGGNCDSRNQQWHYHGSSLVTYMNTGFCLTALSPSDIVLQPCNNSTKQSFTPTKPSQNTTQFQLASSSNLCLSSKPPQSVSANATRIGLALRLGGYDPAKSETCQAYAKTWLNFGYICSIQIDGFWSIWSGTTIYASGNLPKPLSLGEWNHLSISANGSTISCSLNGSTLTTISSPTYPNGWAGLHSGFHQTLFDNVTLNTYNA